MKLKYLLLFIFFTLFFLFNPGDSYYYHLFAYNRQSINQSKTKLQLNINPVPSLRFPYYPFVTAQGIYIADLPSFTPVMELNAKEKFLPASTSKIITALVAYDVYKQDDIVTVRNPIQDGQVMGLHAGEKITVENLMYGLLIHSGNDAAYAIAENYGYDKFIDLMNKKARALHMKDSSFKNPAGLADNNYSTPFDLALAARELLKNKYLAKIVSIKDITISDTDYLYFHPLTNVNKLLGEYRESAG